MRSTWLSTGTSVGGVVGVAPGAERRQLVVGLDRIDGREVVRPVRLRLPEDPRIPCRRAVGLPDVRRHRALPVGPAIRKLPGPVPVVRLPTEPKTSVHMFIIEKT